MAKRRVPISAIAAILSAPLVASVALYSAVQFFLNPVGSSTILVVSLSLSLVVTLCVGPFVHGFLRQRIWVQWFHYAAASAIVAACVAMAISTLIGEWSAFVLLGSVALGMIAGVVSWGILRPDLDRAERHRQTWLGVLGTALVLNAGVIAFNWDHLIFATAVVMSERRPALLADADWDKPASARKFAARFPSGADERELLAWLEANKFIVEPWKGRATRLLSGLPCAEFLEVTWRVSGRVISSAEAHVSGACL